MAGSKRLLSITQRTIAIGKGEQLSRMAMVGRKVGQGAKYEFY